MNINTNITFSTLKKLVTTNLTFKPTTKRYTLHKCSINFTHKFINYITKPEPRIKTIKPKKYDDSYAGTISIDSELKPIYKYTANPKDPFYFNYTHILITENKPTEHQIKLLQKHTITIIYTPDPNTVIIRHKNTRRQYFQTNYQEDATKPLTRSYIFNQLLGSKPLSATLIYNNYNNTENYYQSFQHLLKQLAYHNIHIKFTDAHLYYTDTIPANLFQRSHTVTQPYDLEQFHQIMKPYHNALSNAKRHYEPQTIKPKQLPCQDILNYITTYAPAYGIPIPTLPEYHTTFESNIYTNQIMIIYTQLKYYQDNDIPLNDTYTYCITCDKPFNIHSDTCPHCDTPNEDFDYQEILVTYDNLFTPDDDYN